MGKSKKYGMNTKALHTNKRFEPISGDVMPPLHLSTTYKNEVPGESDYFYGRINNPTRELFERTLASLEGIENYEEQHAFAISSRYICSCLLKSGPAIYIFLIINLN